ncbi:hypothetical protein F503_00287 [Ophiostoma piceae UAMH 11346]|uniref:Uncharacterized protein n=1 Tax=Ophiostoma piceae (strain UAMH 11346) TaxID=1262450 RepID=S3D2P1_OPHP1|nr:hypothetical protein F503_00287 [Ophiostoma piceae UAMH 11346]
MDLPGWLRSLDLLGRRSWSYGYGYWLQGDALMKRALKPGSGQCRQRKGSGPRSLQMRSGDLVSSRGDRNGGQRRSRKTVTRVRWGKQPAKTAAMLGGTGGPGLLSGLYLGAKAEEML